jgi:tyrosyl-tRNA synthetase
VATRGAVNVEVADHLREALASGRKLRVKLGIDPSAPDIHLGHTVVLGKLRDFQRLGHQAVLIIGDFTARIGDPSGRSETRRPLTEAEVAAHAQTYLDQVFKILDRDATEVRPQSEWFGGMDLADVIRLAGKATVAQILQRDDFSKRSAAGHPIGVHELLYPLLQGYDSIAVEADVELGGTDQLYNLLFARDLQREAGGRPQDILTMPLLEGLDGRQKMSKSLGNYVGVAEPPEEMFGKLMSVPDELITRYLRLVTDMPAAEVDQVERDLAVGQNPRDAKWKLAERVVAMYHSAAAATAAGEAFRSQFQRGEVPVEIPEVRVPAMTTWPTYADAMVELALATTKSEARRLINQRGVRLDGEILESPTLPLHLPDGRSVLWQVGRRRVLRVTAEVRTHDRGSLDPDVIRPSQPET